MAALEAPSGQDNGQSPAPSPAQPEAKKIVRRARRQSWADADVLNRRASIAAAEELVWQAECQEWIERVTGVKLGTDLFSGLQSGVVLVKLLMAMDKEWHPKYKTDAVPGTFLARDNMSLFLKKCVELGVPKIQLFEPDDLAQRRNDKVVVSALLYLSRLSTKYGLEPPEIVKFEMEIDQEEKADAAMAAEAPKERKRIPGSPRFVTYIADTGDPIDVAVAAAINAMPKESLKAVTITRVKKGCYQIGDLSYTYVRLVRQVLLVRVGGGWLGFNPFVIRKLGLKRRASISKTFHSSSRLTDSSSTEALPDAAD